MYCGSSYKAGHHCRRYENPLFTCSFYRYKAVHFNLRHSFSLPSRDGSRQIGTHGKITDLPLPISLNYIDKDCNRYSFGQMHHLLAYCMGMKIKTAPPGHPLGPSLLLTLGYFLPTLLYEALLMYLMGQTVFRKNCS